MPFIVRGPGIAHDPDGVQIPTSHVDLGSNLVNPATKVAFELVSGIAEGSRIRHFAGIGLAEPASPATSAKPRQYLQLQGDRPRSNGSTVGTYR